MKPQIEIVNIYKSKCDVYCGRGSALGNPFRLEHPSQRDDVCEKYKKYFIDQVIVRHNQSMLRQLTAIRRKLEKDSIVKLGCYCAPHRCHCETIRDFILNKLISI